MLDYIEKSNEVKSDIRNLATYNKLQRGTVSPLWYQMI